MRVETNVWRASYSVKSVRAVSRAGSMTSRQSIALRPQRSLALQIAREVEVHGERVAAERDSQEQPDGQAADTARTRAPEFAARGAR